MARRIEIELTSARPDGSWTWRAAGAREPKGVLDGTLLPGASKVGDVLRADADFDVDGITVVAVLAAKGTRKEPERLELLSSGDFEPVVQTLAPKSDRPRRDGERTGERRERRPRPDGPQGRGRPPAGERGNRPARPEGERTRPPGERSERPARPSGERRDRPARPPRPPVPELPARPKPKRLRAGRRHRNELLASLPEEHRPIAEQLLRGGVPAVRQAIAEQNDRLRAEGKPEIKPQGVISLAEELLPAVRVADWLDRAEGAVADLPELDLRDLRSVVAAAEDPVVARDERTGALAAQLRTGLAERQDSEQREWLSDIDAALRVGRSVRALRLSSRPPKAGVPFPPDLAARLAEASSATLTAEASTERWVAVLDALAYAPVRTQVVPAGIPATVEPELLATVTRLSGLLPDIARQLGVEPPAPGSRSPRPPRPGSRPRQKPPADKPKRTPPPPPPPPADESAAAPAPGEAPEAREPASVADPTSAEVASDAPAEQVAPTGADTASETSQEAPADEPAVVGSAPVEPAAADRTADEPATEHTAADEPAVAEPARADSAPVELAEDERATVAPEPADDATSPQEP